VQGVEVLGGTMIEEPTLRPGLAVGYRIYQKITTFVGAQRFFDF
jgi:hypothetical protein